MINGELRGIIDEIERTYANYNMTMETLGQTKEALREKYRDTAVKQAQRHIILNKIIEQEKLTISDEAMADSFQEIADSMQQPVDVVKQFYQGQPEQIQVLRYSLLEKEAMNLVIASSEIKETEPEEIKPEKTED